MKIPCPLLIFSQSDYLIQVVDIYLMANSADPDQLASKKPTDLDLHCLERQSISGFSRIRIKKKKSSCNKEHKER